MLLHNGQTPYGYKKGTSACGEKYITAASGEDTKIFSRCILDAYSCRLALFEIIAG